MLFYHVRNWENFQHYKDRNPPWIKLHFELLSSTDWVTLDDAGRVLAIACMLVASRNNGRVPADPHYMKRVAYLNTLPKFKPLLDCGFLEILQANASALLADASTLQANARPERREERAGARIDTDSSKEESKKVKKESKGRGTRFALQDPPDDWIQFCVTQRPDLQPGDVFDQFRDYWIAKTGNAATKLDWFATWRNWVRNQKSSQTKGKTHENESRWDIAARKILEDRKVRANLALPDGTVEGAEKLR